MILECSITNYRSIFEKQTFSMIASSARSKVGNTIDLTLDSGESIKLLRTAAIYGSNASGKTNFIRLLFEIRKFIVETKEISVDSQISLYDPFKFQVENMNQKSDFELIFLTKEKNKFHYKLSFNSDEILEESLYHFPKKKSQIIFERGSNRIEADANIHEIILGKSFGYKKYRIFKKIPLLSIFGKAENYHTTISPVFSYFNDLEVWNATSNNWINLLGHKIRTELQRNDYDYLITGLSELIHLADTQVESLSIENEDSMKDTQSESSEVEGSINRPKKRDILFGEHKVFQNKKEVSIHYLPFNDESFGTNKLVAIGGLILKIIKQGGVIVFDELDSGLHPLLTQLLIQTFQNAHDSFSQLIFTTHETNLLSNEFRSDQIWFTQKNEFGQTELFSAQDFEGVREDIPFDKWYLGGKFGGIPKIIK